MWETKNDTPFSVCGYFCRDRHGFEHWIVAVRASFILGRVGLPRIGAQTPVRLAPDYTDSRAIELVREADLSPFRPRPDIVLQGQVHPAEPNDRSAMISLSVGVLQKHVQAFGPRTASRRGRVWRVERAALEPFELSWTRALGGVDQQSIAAGSGTHPANPIGMGWVAEWAKLPESMPVTLPQMERSDVLLNPSEPPPAPVGFGPIQPAWQPRAGRAGTYDAAWLAGQAPVAPSDFDDAFHQAVSDDQVYPSDLFGGEPCRVTSLHADGPLEFRLPQIVLTARTRLGISLVDTRFRLIGIEIDGTRRTLDMIWNTSLACPGGDHLVRYTNIGLQQMAGVAS